jgi:hypothetical protein
MYVFSANFLQFHSRDTRDCTIQRETWYIGPCAGVDYNLTLCRLQSRLQHMYTGNPLSQTRLFPPVKD